MARRNPHPGWLAITAFCVLLLVIAILLADYWAVGIAAAAALLTGIQAFSKDGDGDGDGDGAGNGPDGGK